MRKEFRIGELCKKKGITLKQLAEGLNIHPVSFTQALSDKGNPTFETLSKIASFLQVGLSELFRPLHINNIIFDFDLTLINRSISDQYRKQRNWTKVFELIPQFTLYDGLNEVFSYIRANNIQVTIVSFAKPDLIEATAKYFKIPYNFIIAGNQIKNKKPHPESFYKALELMNCKSNEVISFGDSIKDYEAAKVSNIKHIACLWDSEEETELKQNGCELFISNPSEIIDILLGK